MLPPPYVIEEVAGTRHKVKGWYDEGRVVLTTCNKRIALGGKRNSNPVKCGKEK